MKNSVVKLVVLGIVGAVFTVQNEISAMAEMPVFRRATVTEGVASQGIWHDSFEEGWNEAKKRDVPMVVYITSDHCIYCDAMKKDTWCNESVMQRLRDDFVGIRLHRERDSALLKRIVVPAFPMTLIATPQGKVVSHRVGYQPPSEIQGLLTDGQRRLLSLRR